MPPENFPEQNLTLDAWLGCWAQLGVRPSAALGSLHADLLAHYGEAHRHYHTTQHLSECLHKAQAMAHLAEHPAEVMLALWFHDAIYDTQKSDNEERSAAWAKSALIESGASADAAQRVHELVMLTRHAAEPASVDAQILVDADLSILGAPTQRFDQYENQVRTEYDWVPEPVFRSKRMAVLKSFLDREQIFNTADFHQQYEDQACRNLCRSMARLKSRRRAAAAQIGIGRRSA